MNLDRIFDTVCSRDEFAEKFEFICDAVPSDAMISIYTCECCDRPHMSIRVAESMSDEHVFDIQRKLKQLFS